MTWLVTGGSGFLGRHLLRRLSDRGIAARSVDLEPLDLDLPGVEHVVGDVRDERLIRAVLDDVVVVVHAAAALPSGGDLDGVNVEASGRLARLASAAGVERSVLISSGVVYGLPEPPVRETATPRPIEPYGRSKLAAEQVWLERAPAPLLLRPSAFIGPERLGVFGILFRWVREGRRLYVLGDGGNRYQLLDVADLVRAIELGAAATAEGVVNVGGRVSGSVRDDLEALVRHARSASVVTGVPARPARAALAALDAVRLSPLSTWHRRSADRDLVFDCGRARTELGWEPAWSGADALRRAYDWYRAEGTGRPVGTTHRAVWGERALGLLRRVS
jgi:nucleoside-diphosphate-sugar epimerase